VEGGGWHSSRGQANLPNREARVRVRTWLDRFAKSRSCRSARCAPEKEMALTPKSRGEGCELFGLDTTAIAI
jgi:hypothetical protein